MITQIEIDGFKTFKDFKVELAPFQVIVGPNGSGKSNLFDALHLLSRLAEKDIYTAFQELRGDAGELFTKFPDGKTSERIWIAVEMLVDRKVKDITGKEIDLKYRRLRYELEISIYSKDFDSLDVTQESLKLIPYEVDVWSKKYAINLANSQLPNDLDNDYSLFKTFGILEDRSGFDIQMYSNPFDADKNMRINEKDETQGRQLVYTSLWTSQLDTTILSRQLITVVLGNKSLTSHYATAVRNTLQSLKFLHLNPQTLREPSSMNAPRDLAPDGSNLPTMLARMQAEDEFALTDVSRAVASMVQDISRIKVQKNEATNKYAIWAETVDHRTFSAEVLSDGTLRLLALAAMSYDPHFRGILCLEEPENGVQPLQLEKMALLLREMATDLNDPEQINEPLRQVLITTHSSLFISQPHIIDSLLLAITASLIQSKGQPVLHVTRMEPVITPNTLSHIENNTNDDIALMSYAINTVKRYLGSGELEEAQNQLNKAHSQLPKKEQS
jgi:predicted ATPase